MSWIATAIVGSAAIGVISSRSAGSSAASGARDAANIQAAATEKGVAETRRQFDILQEQMEPFRETGLTANEQINQLLAGDMSAFQESPGYQFQLGEGEKSVNRLVSQQGRLNTGSQSKDLLRFSQGLGSQEYNNYLNQLAVLSGRGQAATGSVGSAGANMAANIGNLLQSGAAGQGAALQNAAQARASTYMGYGNIANNALNQYMQYQGMQAGGLSPGTPGAVSPGNYGQYTSPGYVPPGGSFG